MKRSLPFFIFVLLCGTIASVHAQAPEITPFEQIYFTQGMTTTYQVEVDGHGDQLSYSLTGAPDGMTISNTGLIRYQATLQDQFYTIANVVVENQDSEQSTQEFVAATRSALQINNVQIGTNDEDLQSISNWGQSVSYHPGDEVYVRFHLENAYTQNNNPYLNLPIQPTIESLEYTIRENSGIPFFNEQKSIENPLSAQESQEYNIKGRLPIDLLTGSYQVFITTAGFDQEVPPNELLDTFSFSLPIVRNPHALILTPDVPFAVHDGVLSCDESAQTGIPFTLSNTGQADEIAVISLRDRFGNVLNDMHLPIAVGEEIEGSIDAFLPRENDNTLTVAVARVQDPAVILNQFSFNYTSDLDCSSLAISSTTPLQDELTLRMGSTQEFNVAILNPSNLPYVTQWWVDNQLVENSNSYLYEADSVGVHIIELDVIQEDATAYRQLWTVTITDLPFGFDSFPGAATTDPSLINDVHTTPLTLENQFGKIEFDQNVDLSTIENLSRVVSITNGKVAVDSPNAPTLNRPATITLYHAYTDPKIMTQPGFNSGQLSACGACIIISHTADTLTFHVPSFSTYVGVENSGVQLQIDGTTINSILQGQTGNATITLTNVGGEDITNLHASLLNVAAKYQARIIDPLPAILHPGEQAIITLSIFVPMDESDIAHNIGSIQVTSNEITANQILVLDPASYIEVQNIKVNSKTNGKLNLDSNKIEFHIKNNYPQDMDDVSITVRILDVNGDDIEEDINSFTLRSGSDKRVSATLDLSGEQLDEDQYTIELDIQADADDNTNHDTLVDFVSDVERDRHSIAFTRTDLSLPKLTCDTQTSLYVTVENKGKSNEDNIEIHVTNSNLNIDQYKKSIELDDYSGPDQEYSAIFPIDVTGKKVGTSPIKVELFQDGSLEETQTVNLEIATCSQTTSTGSITTLGDSARGDALKNQLNQALMQRQGGVSTSQISASFRDSGIYTMFLAVLVFFALIAVMLGIAVAIKRR